MKKLLEKLNYKGQERIALLNAEESFSNLITIELKDVILDKEIDPRYPYEFIIVFVKSVSDVNNLTSIALHNLVADGILWFCYPKKTSKKYRSELNRDHGWKELNDCGLYGVRVVSIDEDWSAVRFRNIKFIKSISKRIMK